MSDTYEKDPQVRAEMAVEELRRSWIEVLRNWPAVMRDRELVEIIGAVRSGVDMKLGTPRRAA